MPENPVVAPEAEQLISWTAFCCPLSLKANRIAYLSNDVPKWLQKTEKSWEEK